MFPILALFFLAIYSCEKDQMATPFANGQNEMVAPRNNAVQPFKGSYHMVSSEFIPAIGAVHFIFEGNATHLGKSTWEAYQWNYPDGTLSGTFTATAANGDQLTGHYVGTYFIEDGVVYFTGPMYVTAEGNTGRFECVTGELPYEGYNILGTGTAEFFMENGFLDFTNEGC